MFPTQDGAFVRKVVSERMYHAGILWLPVGWEVGELEAAVSVFVYRRPSGTWNRPDCPCS